MIADDTIVAISSATGPAARMIVRLSGPDAHRLCGGLLSYASIDPTAAVSRARLSASGLEFPATLYRFFSPHSATGQDVAEIHLPGNPLLARIVLTAALEAGARSAEPGEFTARSFFNGRVDLAAAEGVGAIIASQNQRELDGARRLLAGELSNRLRPVMDRLAQMLALVEAEIDFAGEEISILAIQQIRDRIAGISRDLQQLIAESNRFESLSHEPRIVLVGRPNAGKSTLLNALAGHDRAIVSPTAGTTRDVLTASVALARGIVTLLDAAGIDDSADVGPINAQMRSASMHAVRTADVIVLVREANDRRSEISLELPPHLRIQSKADLLTAPSVDFAVSAHTGQGIDALREQLDILSFGERASDSTLALNARHLQALHDAIAALSRANELGESELIALELREALDALGSILGSVTPDDVLGKIFSAFCIGK